MLLVNGKKIEQPVMVELPADGGYKTSKIFNFAKGCCIKGKLPKLSVTEENLSSLITNDNKV